jgi:uncharacterized protein (DUF1800 family)
MTMRRPGASVLLSYLLASPLPAAPAATAPPSDTAQVVHVLNRLGFGPRPGDVEHVQAMGVERWIDEQLHPERIPDAAVKPRLAVLQTAGLDTARLMKGYEVPADAKKEIKKKQAETSEGVSEDQERKSKREILTRYRDQMEGTPKDVVEDLQAAKLIRATYSERQLEEVLTDFWMNHFNVYAQKGAVKFLVGEYEREAVRPRVLGKFEDLLKATAESPAMLFYLDNWLSTGTGTPGSERSHRGRGRGYGRAGRGRSFGEMPPQPARAVPATAGKGKKRGLNENYAREIMELHTLGVDGGYTQQDVTEVARCFTGWTIRGLKQQDPEFRFEARLHDPGDKQVLGQRIHGGGKDEGDKVIHLLATHPSTARFISYKLARRFVADEPPTALVDRAAETFRSSGGDLRAVLETILKSAEFLAPEAVSAKVKTPFEFAVSALRASRADIKDARDLARRLGEMGMPLYLQQPPTGYKDTADAWVSTSGLLARLNFALDLAAGTIVGVSVDATRLAPDRLLPTGLSETTRRTLEGEGGQALPPTRMAGLILGSPEFQRR